MTNEEKQRFNELIVRLADHVNFPYQLMHDLAVEGQIIVKYTLDIETGEFTTERIG